MGRNNYINENGRHCHSQQLHSVIPGTTETQVQAYFARLKAKNAASPGNNDDASDEVESDALCERDRIVAKMLDELGEAEANGETGPQYGCTGPRRVQLHLKRWCR